MKTIVISSHLVKRYPAVAIQLRALHNPVEIATDNLWLRDFMPVQTGPSSFVKFVYQGYGMGGLDQFPWLRVQQYEWKLKAFEGKVKQSRIRLDGGNVMYSPDRSLVLMTEMVFRHNLNIPKAKLITRLEKLLNAHIVTIPVEPGDDIGHIDGCCVFTPTTHGGSIVGRKSTTARPHVLLNNYRTMPRRSYQVYADKISEALLSANIDYTLFPYAYHRCPNITEHMFRRQFPQGDLLCPAFGYYINMLVFDGQISLPSFGIDEDTEALVMTKTFFPHHTVHQIDCRKLSMEGGLLNCITADYDFPG